MSPQPLISVIIPVYNTGALLRQSLESLLNQTLRDWEAICVDDGSIDGSGKLLDVYAGGDSRIKVVHKPNGGVSSARNCGLDHASALYITMLDADDYFSPTALEQLYSCMQAHDCDVVCCTMSKVYPDGHTEVEQPRFDGGLHKAVPADVYRFAMRSPCCKLYKRNIIEKGKIRFPLGIPICEDDVFVVSYWYHVRSFYMLSEPLYNYVQSKSSVLKKLGEGLLPLECYFSTLDVPITIHRYIESQKPTSLSLCQWKKLLLKSQLYITEWMCKCHRDKNIRRKMRAHARHNVQMISQNLSKIYIVRTLARVRLACCIKELLNFARMIKIKTGN